MELTPELITVIAQTAGGPGLMLLGLYIFWYKAVKVQLDETAERLSQDLQRTTTVLEKDIDKLSIGLASIRADLNSHREVITDEQRRLRDSLKELEMWRKYYAGEIQGG